MKLPRFRRSFHNRNIHALYGMIVTQARAAIFYTDYGVADTVQGRFELIVLHLVLLLRRLARENAARTQSPVGRPQPGAGRWATALRRVSATTSTTICGKWALATSRCRARCGVSARRSTAARPPTARRSLPADERELEMALARNIFGVVGVDDQGSPAGALCPRGGAAIGHRGGGRSRRRQRGLPQPGGLCTCLNIDQRENIRAKLPVPWRVPVAVEDVAETGERFDLEADAATRAPRGARSGAARFAAFSRRLSNSSGAAKACMSAAGFPRRLARPASSPSKRLPTRSRRTSMSSSCRRRRRHRKAKKSATILGPKLSR